MIGKTLNPKESFGFDLIWHGQIVDQTVGCWNEAGIYVESAYTFFSSQSGNVNQNSNKAGVYILLSCYGLCSFNFLRSSFSRNPCHIAVM